MGIKEKATYGDYYWASQVEAARLLSEESEKELSTMAASLMGSLRIKEILPTELVSLFNQIEAPAGAFLGDVGGRFVSEVADGAVSQAASPFFESMGYAAYEAAPTKKMTPAATATLYQRKKIDENFFMQRFRMGGFEPIEAQFQYESMRPYPAIPDLILYSRYTGDPDNVWSTLLDIYDMSPTDFPLWEWLSFERLTTDHVQELFKRRVIEEPEFYDYLARIGYQDFERPYLAELSFVLPNAMLMVQGNLQQEQGQEKILTDITRADIHADYAQTYLDAVLTKPSTSDLIAYNLRQDPTLSDLERRLRKIGIHPAYFDVYRELAHIIPPVADIITMAVREAFSPAIAARFGQYEDFPPEFEVWAEKKGLTAEWAKRYWAAHWSLPSPAQGFEMLHRGIINQEELNLLLRALDVMPFWRDRLTKMAYSLLTRVDIRRMYGVGVLDEADVYEAYLERGYNDRDAKRMTEFTVRQTLATQSKFTSTDVISAYTKRMINRSEARSLLLDVGIKTENVDFVLTTAEYKREWELTEAKISGIRNLYKKRVYTDNAARAELLKLDLPTEQVDVLMEQWFYEVKAEPARTWTTAQTLSFIKAKIITRERGIRELQLMGYDSEHIEVYLKGAA
jgi:hypothetical protein